MKISEIYNLNKSQAELDFVDIDVTEDIPLFVDPFFLSKKTDNLSYECKLTLRSFFQAVIDLMRAGNNDEARALFEHLHEPNATCLGLSQGNPQGKGVGNGDADKIFDSILESGAVESGLITDIEDSILFVENFGKDKLSDMTTNIITRHLIAYTQNQCNLHGIPLTIDVPSGYYWDRGNLEWTNEHKEMLIVNGKKILLVPKGIVSFCQAYTPEKYYNQFVLVYLQNENIAMNTALVQKRKNGVRYVTKKSIAADNPVSKDFLRAFSLRNPEILAQFKQETDLESLANSEITEIDIEGLKRALIEKLNATPSGSESAQDYHKLMIGILQIIFYPHLINPIKEGEILEGRKRIDITFDNASKAGIFSRLHPHFRLLSPYIFVECKNYSRDIANPELDQMGGRFGTQRTQVGIIVCRTIDNMDLFLQRCRDTYRDGRGLIIPLVDDDVISLLQNYDDWNWDYIEKFLSDRIRVITAN